MISFVPFALLLVIVSLVSGRVEMKWRDLVLYFLGGILTGWGFSGVFEHFYPDLYHSSLRTPLDGLMTVVGFGTLVYFFKNDLAGKLMDKYLNGKIGKKDEVANDKQDGNDENS